MPSISPRFTTPPMGGPERFLEALIAKGRRAADAIPKRNTSSTMGDMTETRGLMTRKVEPHIRVPSPRKSAALALSDNCPPSKSDAVHQEYRLSTRKT